MLKRNLNLIYKRVQNGYTQLKLSKALNEIGDNCSQEVISKYENGELKPRLERAKNIAKILNCSIDEIF